MSDFKQQVEEIVSIALAGECPVKPCPSVPIGVRSCKDCFTDRILAAHNAELERIAKGMDSLKGKVSKPPKPMEQAVSFTINSTVRLCQAYLLAERAGK